jgi:hypothetical protein
MVEGVLGRENVMDDISRVGRIEFIAGRGQTSLFPKQGKRGKAGKGKSPKAVAGEDEFHLHAEPIDESVEILDKNHVDVKA